MRGARMWKWVGIVLVLLVATPAWSQTAPIFKPLHIFQDAETATGDGVSLLIPGWATIGVQVVISDAATVTFEATADGSNWVSVACTSIASTSGAMSTTATASGIYQCPVAGMGEFRARISGFAGGTVTVKGITTVARRNGAGGGGSGIVVAEEDGNPSVSGVSTLTVPDGLLTDDGSGAVSLASPSTPTLDNVFDQGKTIDGANSLANAVRIGGDTTAKQVCIYNDDSTGLQVRPCTDANTRTLIPTNFTWSLHDEEGAAAIETVDPDAASTLAMWTYGTAYRPKKSIWFGAGSLSTDGTQCAAPAEVTINSGPKIWTIICTDNDGSTIYGSVKMPDNWDAGTVTFDHVYIQTAADTSALNGDIAAQCRANGEAPSSTWGTEVAIDDAGVTGTNRNDMTTSAAVTPASGTSCAAGNMLYWRYQLDATGTTTAVATLHHVGFRMEYSETSRSQ
jgi:hypothetical protein